MKLEIENQEAEHILRAFDQYKHPHENGAIVAAQLTVNVTRKIQDAGQQEAVKLKAVEDIEESKPEAAQAEAESVG